MKLIPKLELGNAAAEAPASSMPISQSANDQRSSQQLGEKEAGASLGVTKLWLGNQ